MIADAAGEPLDFPRIFGKARETDNEPALDGDPGEVVKAQGAARIAAGGSLHVEYFGMAVKPGPGFSRLF